MLKILIAEDERELRQLFSHILIKNGYLVKGVSNGKEALNALDNEYYDLIIGMDNANMRNMKRFWNGDPENKLRMLLDYTDSPGEVADPWYSGDFERTWKDVYAGCRGLMEDICE